MKDQMLNMWKEVLINYERVNVGHIVEAIIGHEKSNIEHMVKLLACKKC